jgi:hypothetical protein
MTSSGGRSSALRACEALDAPPSRGMTARIVAKYSPSERPRSELEAHTERVADHQPPTALNFRNSPQRLYPQCIDCSVRQGGWVNQIKRGN